MNRLLDIYSKYRHERNEKLWLKALFNSEAIFKAALAKLEAQKKTRDDNAWKVFHVNELKSELHRKKQEYYSVRKQRNLTPQEKHEWEQDIADIEEKCNEKIRVYQEGFFAERKESHEAYITKVEDIEEQQRKRNADFGKDLNFIRERLRIEEAGIIETYRVENAEKGGEQ